MKLLEQFEKYNYKSLLKEEIASSFQVDIDYFLDENKKKPEELYGIYISSRGDEIFLLLIVNNKNIRRMCEEWDRKVSMFVAFGSEERVVLRRFKYNIIEIILCKEQNIDRTEESSLNVTRKIILPYDIEDDGTILIPDEEIVELPFYMIPINDFAPNEESKKKLEKSMPKEGLEILFQENKKGRGAKKTFDKEYYDKIEEWLKHVYQERENK